MDTKEVIEQTGIYINKMGLSSCQVQGISIILVVAIGHHQVDVHHVGTNCVDDLGPHHQAHWSSLNGPLMSLLYIVLLAKVTRTSMVAVAMDAS